MPPSDLCSPNGNGFLLMATWVLLLNGRWIEIGVASGSIEETCCNSEEHHYVTYWHNGTCYEYRLTGSISPFDNTYYEISDTNKDMKRYAHQIDNKRAGPIMGGTHGDMAVGVECADDDVSSPKIDVKYITAYGSTWSYWTYNDDKYGTNDGFVAQCTPACKNVKVGVGGSETC